MMGGLVIQMFFICVETEKCRKPNSNDQVKDKGDEIEVAVIGIAALFKENEWKAEAGDGVGAGGKPEQGWQATVREKMRGKEIGENEDRESDQKSF